MTGHRDEVSALAAWLHSKLCYSISWSVDCQRPDGGEHGRRLRSTAKDILAADDPAKALHGTVCDAEVQQHHGLPGCPIRDLHIEAAAKVLGEILPSPTVGAPSLFDEVAAA